MGFIMLEALLGNVMVEKVLFYLLAYGEGYPRSMADNFGVPVSRIQQQLKRLENGGIVVSRLMGRVRIYTFNPRYPFLEELKVLLAKSFAFVPEKEKRGFYMRRTRPRRQGKSL
jgi:DNA-binding transcriptional ArsR family regulator